ncbi:reverse transcriptase domain-containing protein [Devosia sp. XJ19-1]|uniref:Reverse transcriptase domain-containing protein n=1 Tax=Devosia ureilytica TaxID=2952754 RepID=A0A9Q4FSM7_9HYPH|nr:reverse transcriptase domain-containing protein [Devosia ureilytica]MCP8887482.1 reverse transcriptase domain-containing protein [Devosia ureilytica]
MQEFFRAAIENIYKHGDTDIFPFPIENRILYDKIDSVLPLLVEAHENFDSNFAANAPQDISSLVPAGTFGFRQGTQLDPFWNAFFLGNVLSVAEKIEDARLSDKEIFSYRLSRENYMSGDTFRRDIGWIDFMRRSAEIAEQHEYIVVCDIADCYSRISHHKIENALQLIGADPKVRKSIMGYLGNLTQTRSSGLPIGGPASRILAELALVNSDIYMRSSQINFTRYADDYHIFCTSKHEAYASLLNVSKILSNDSLSLQKSKTRILTRAEFIAVNKNVLVDAGASVTPVQRLMSLTLRYDPYSSNAEQDYEALKSELNSIDIVALLNEQLAQTRVHVATTKKIISALRHVSESAQFGAAISMLDNMDVLYPIASNVFIAIASFFKNLNSQSRSQICDRIRDLYSDKHEVLQSAANLAFANRIISMEKSALNQEHLHRCYDNSTDSIVRRDVIITFANWQNFAWISMEKQKFQTLSLWERRALILASYYLNDEGKHWRGFAKDWFNPFESIVRDWRAEKQPDFKLPL